MKLTHVLLLLTPDGEDYQIDYPRYYDEPEKVGIEEIREFDADLGSKWYFYPFHFIIKNTDYEHYSNGNEVNNKRIIETPDGFEFLKNKKVKTVRNFLKDNPNLLEN